MTGRPGLESGTEFAPRAKRPRRLRAFVTRWEMVWHTFTVLLFAIAIGLVIAVFPDVSNTWVSVFVLIGSFTASVAAMIASIKTKGEGE